MSDDEMDTRVLASPGRRSSRVTPRASASKPPVVPRSENKPRRRKLFEDGDGGEAPSTSTDDPESAASPAKVLKSFISKKLTRWAACEFHLSRIDSVFFSHNEFVDYLIGVGVYLPQRLTRLEWSALRSLVGKPRRLSAAFLGEERTRLHQTRENIRALAMNRLPPFPDVEIVVPNDGPVVLATGQKVIVLKSLRDAVEGVIISAGDGAYYVNMSGVKEPVQVADTMVMPVMEKRSAESAPSKRPKRVRLQTTQLLEHMSRALALLRLKGQIVQMLHQFNNTVAEKGLSCVTPAMQQLYAAHVVRLDNINKLLAPSLTVLRESRDALALPVPIAASLTQARAQANHMVLGVAADVDPLAKKHDPAHRIVGSAMTLLVALKGASQESMSIKDVDHAVTTLRPQYDSNLPLYGEMLTSVNALIAAIQNS